MTELLASGKLVKRRWGLFICVFVVLLLAASLAVYRSPYQYQVVMFFYSTTQRIDIGDAGVLSGEPCSAPCVFGIRAGETQFDEVPALLEKNGVSKCDTEPNISWVAIHCGFGRFNVQASTHTNLVNSVWFYPNESIYLGEIFEKYGEPNFVYVAPSGLREAPTIQMFLFWDSMRMSVVLPQIDGETYAVEKATRVELIGFSDEDLHQDSSEVEIVGLYKLWNGYGTYQP